MRYALQTMSASERRSYLLVCMSPGHRDLPAAQADADDIFNTMSDTTLREIRETAQRLADAAGARIVNPIEGIDVPKIEDMNREMLRNEAIGAIAAVWTSPGGATAFATLTKRAKNRLLNDWPELHRAVSALVGTLR